MIPAPASPIPREPSESVTSTRAASQERMTPPTQVSSSPRAYRCDSSTARTWAIVSDRPAGVAVRFVFVIEFPLFIGCLASHHSRAID